MSDEILSPSPERPVAQFEIGNHYNFVYLILDWENRKAAVVDPQSDLSPLTGFLDSNGFSLSAVFLTHTHSDHTAGLPEIVNRFPGIPVHLNREDAGRFKESFRAVANLVFVADNDRLRVGDVEVQVLHTPGHSPGELCFLISGAAPPYLLTGDTVFIRDCGRTDFPGGSTEQMFHSLQRIKRLPPETVILPGHHYVKQTTSTIAEELRTSGPFQCQTVSELERLP